MGMDEPTTLNYKDLDLMTVFNIIKPNVRVDQSQDPKYGRRMNKFPKPIKL